MARDELAAHPASASIFLSEGAPAKTGAQLFNRDLARTLQAVVEHGWAGFDTGPTAKQMVHFAETSGGFFSLADLSRQKAVWAEPLIGQYRDVTLYNTPPPTQGFTVIEMLNLLEPRKLYQKRFLGPDHLHLLVQAKQIAYHDRDRLLADPAYADVPIDRLISKEYARRRARLIDDKAAPPWD